MGHVAATEAPGSEFLEAMGAKECPLSRIGLVGLGMPVEGALGAEDLAAALEPAGEPCRLHLVHSRVL